MAADILYSNQNIPSKHIWGHSIRTSARGGGEGVIKLRTIAYMGCLSSEDVLKGARRAQDFFPFHFLNLVLWAYYRQIEKGP